MNWMLSILIIAFFPFNCHVKAQELSARIVGGFEAKQNQFPYQISLRLNRNHVCGGSILSQTVILTAAHCVSNQNKKLLPANVFSVLAGSVDRQQGGTTVNVKEIIMHEDFGSDGSDIAIVKLSQPLKFTQSIAPITLFDKEVPEKEKILISGWGAIGNSKPGSRTLKYITLDAYSIAKCQAILGNTSNIICLGHSKDSGACYGDSGGPAAYKGQLVGVASFVIGVCGSSMPDGYAKVSYFLKWIRSHM